MGGDIWIFPMNWFAVAATLGMLCQSLDVAFTIIMGTCVVGVARVL